LYAGGACTQVNRSVTFFSILKRKVTRVKVASQALPAIGERVGDINFRPCLSFGKHPATSKQLSAISLGKFPHLPLPTPSPQSRSPNPSDDSDEFNCPSLLEIVP